MADAPAIMGWFTYTDDIGTVWAIRQNFHNGLAVGNVPITAAQAVLPPWPRRKRARRIHLVSADGTRSRNLVVGSKDNPFFTGSSSTLSLMVRKLDGTGALVDFSSTGRIGERWTIPKAVVAAGGT
jgi:hypothetical protein